MIGLPWLEAMTPVRKAMAGGAAPPLRFVAVYVPCGIHMADWTPTATGTNFTLPYILEPLADLQSDILVLSGLDNHGGEFNAPGDHARGTGSFLSCTVVNLSETDITNQTTIDQLYAQAVGTETPMPSLQLGTEGGGNVGNCDSGYSCAYSRNISWNGNTPIPKLTDTATAFDLLFAGFDPQATAAELARRKARRLSVLDYAVSDAEALKIKLGHSDQIKVEEYLDSVRDLELRVQAESTSPACDLGAFDPNFQDYAAHVRLMCDIIVKAMQCDRTRAITFMMENGGSNRDFGFIGAPGGHHYISHHNNEQANFDKLRIIDRWEVEQLAYLLAQLKASPEGPEGGSVLDNSCIFFGSEIEDGNSHAHVNMPVLVAGKLGGTIETGKHTSFGDVPLDNLFVAIGQRLGLDIDSYGQFSTGPLDI
jgi:hypothetical protein